MAKRAPMTAEQARAFGRYSVGNAVAVATALTCGCQAYEDVYTYRRWQALGYQVRRGEHAIQLPLVYQVTREVEKDGVVVEQDVRRLGSSHVFCRHQVDTNRYKG